MNKIFVEKLLGELKCHEVNSIAKLPPNLLKDCSFEIAYPLSFITNLLLIPTEWKTSILTPLHKSADKYAADNYYPISIFPVLPKIMEKAVHLQVNEILENNTLSSSSQSGYTRKRSIELATTLLLDQIRKEANNGNCCMPVIKREHRRCGCRTPNQLFNAMAWDSKLQAIILWCVIIVKLNIGRENNKATILACF